MADTVIQEQTAFLGPQIYASAERNTRGWNYSASVTGATSPDEAIVLLRETLDRLEADLRARPLNG